MHGNIGAPYYKGGHAGNAGSFGGGLGPLPNWVRRLDRVTKWVWCKLLINAARIIHRRQNL